MEPDGTQWDPTEPNGTQRNPTEPNGAQLYDHITTSLDGLFTDIYAGPSHSTRNEFVIFIRLLLLLLLDVYMAAGCISSTIS